MRKWVYSGYGTVIDGAGSWNVGNDFARNVVNFGVHNSSSRSQITRSQSFTLTKKLFSRFDNRENNFLVKVND